MPPSESTTSAIPTNSQSSATVLPPLDLADIQNLYLIAKTLVDGIYQGRHATPERGGSTEFFDYRAWTEGESSAGIDWKVFGRSDRLYVRRFQHFGNLTLQLIVDGSGSMDYATSPQTPTKWAYATHLASALALLAIRQSEQVALAIAVDSIREAIPPASGFAQLYRMLHVLEDYKPAGTEQFGSALQQAQQLLPRRRVIFILSDFLGDLDEITASLQRLRFHGNDVCCLQILSPSEIDLTGLEFGRFVDCERPTDAAAVVTNIASIQHTYTQLLRAHIESVHLNLRRLGVDHFLVKTDEHPLAVLRRVLGERQALADAGISRFR